MAMYAEGYDVMPDVRGRGGGAGAFFNDIDVENEMEFLAATDVVPDVVKTFVTYFYSHIRDRNVFEIMNAYDTAWNNLSERYFKISSWPPAEIIAGLVDNDAVFLLLYKEMYYRHIYSKLEPTLEQRCESWDNYCALFNIFLQGNVNMQLPLQWLWDMIDEFGYQFQSFSQYRAKLKNKTADELALLAECGGVWNVLSVLNYLKAMVDNSDIINKFRDPTAYGADLTPAELAEALNDGWDPCNQATHSNVLPALGYFAQVGLARVHSLLGDYHTALAKVDSLDLSHPKGQLYTIIPECHVNVFYYVGFAQLMCRRHKDAMRTFNGILLYVSRTKTFLQRLGQTRFEQILKKNEQMYSLLALTIPLCPVVRTLDDGVAKQLREKHGDKLSRMQMGGAEAESVYEELYAFGCPKFVTTSVPPEALETLNNYNTQAYNRQLQCFMAEVRQQDGLQLVRSFLKLYTTISLEQLSSILAGSPEGRAEAAKHAEGREGVSGSGVHGSGEMSVEGLMQKVMCMKHKTTNKTWSGEGGCLSGTWETANDVNFRVEGHVVHVADTKVLRRYGEYFTQNIQRMAALSRDIRAIKVAFPSDDGGMDA